MHEEADHRQEYHDKTETEIEEGIVVQFCGAPDVEKIEIGDVAPVERKTVVDKQSQPEAAEEYRDCGQDQQQGYLQHGNGQLGRCEDFHDSHLTAVKMKSWRGHPTKKRLNYLTFSGNVNGI
jgi:hypothetical protein